MRASSSSLYRVCSFPATVRIVVRAAAPLEQIAFMSRAAHLAAAAAAAAAAAVLGK